MSNKKSFSIQDRLKSFVFAFSGIKTFFSTEHNSWIHVIAAITAISLGIVLKINDYQWCLIVMVIGLVIVAEIINTAIEKIVDMVSPQYNEMAKKVKDMSAAAVLVAAITALCVGVFIFVPKLLNN
jgi:diacylglycerol kinase (ATP)